MAPAALPASFTAELRYCFVWAGCIRELKHCETNPGSFLPMAPDESVPSVADLCHDSLSLFFPLLPALTTWVLIFQKEVVLV